MSRKEIEEEEKSEWNREKESEKNQVCFECDVAIRFRCQMMSFCSFSSSFTIHVHIGQFFLRSLMSKCLLRRVVQPTQFCHHCQSLRIVRVRTLNNSSTPISDTSHTSANKVICSCTDTDKDTYTTEKNTHAPCFVSTCLSTEHEREEKTTKKRCFTVSRFLLPILTISPKLMMAKEEKYRWRAFLAEADVGV